MALSRQTQAFITSSAHPQQSQCVKASQPMVRFTRQSLQLYPASLATMWLLLVPLAVVYAWRKIAAIRQAARSVGDIPGYRTLISRGSLLSSLIPKTPGLSLGTTWTFDDKYSVYADNGYDILTLVSAFPCKPEIVLADAAAIKEVITYRSRFPKPVDLYAVLSFFGYNIVASEGEEWKRYRKITAPTFTERNNKLVWNETVAIMNDLFDNVWENQQVVTIDHILDITLPATLFIISAAGFGQKLTWKGGSIVPPHHKMTFKDALYTTATYIIPKLLLPNWAMKLTEKTRRIKLGFAELRTFMAEMIEDRMKSDKVGRDDLLSSLLDASNEGEGLSTDELIGHETTAHTLCFTLALLALYPAEQEKLYQHIKSVLPDAYAPTYEQFPLLTRVMAVFNETLRMFPAVVIIPKRSAEDTTLSTTSTRGERVVVPIPKGTDVHINVPGLHYNPKYWENPYEFKPDRFLNDDWNRDAFIPFSAGPRACLGRRFAETEAVAFLTMLVSRYKITVKEEPRFANETFEQRKERLLKVVSILTLTPVKMPLTFTRR
ncbi:hypothetical protein D9756_008375 [Leucocoprinus leucothites]|uniref:Cytochrome P450 n=1 Tax=Leucocoprinus leucothites TaxID=201217 RepID=A0A8H5CZU6_9AGAR|nr:hypothetical protein D9756_008375 [Leucoagaricus leucothites]